jgi:isoleucyl-tRNA synthetase
LSHFSESSLSKTEIGYKYLKSHSIYITFKDFEGKNLLDTEFMI